MGHIVYEEITFTTIDGKERTVSSHSLVQHVDTDAPVFVYWERDALGERQWGEVSFDNFAAYIEAREAAHNCLTV